MTKKLSLLFLICILSALSINAEVVEGSCGTNVRYSLDTSTGLLSITGTGAMTNYNYASEAPWYSNNSSINTVEIADDVTSIGQVAFSGYRSLRSVTIGNSVTSIGYNAFFGCSNLAKVTLNSNVIVSKSYDSNYSLKKIFDSQVQEYVLGDNVTSIGSYAFNDCYGLTSIIIPNSVTTIGSYAFSGCSGLTSVTIPNSVTSIGYGAFYCCSGLTSIEIPNSVTSIGSQAFQSCSSLTSITIGNSVTRIGDYAFQNCSGLTSATIPNSVTSIGKQAFQSCSGLTSITIGNSVTSIGNYAFQDCSGLTSVTIPNSVRSIGSYAFSRCSGLTSVIIPNSVTSIGSSAFLSCSGLTSVTIPNSVTSIGSYAFQGCSGLTSVKSEISVPFTFGSDAFSYISSNCVLTVPYGTKDAYITKGWTTSVFKGGIKEIMPIVDGIYYDFNSNNKQATVTAGENKYSGNVTIPSSVTYNGETYSVTSIGNNAFNGCYGLTSIEIPNSVTSIGKSAFSGCSGLTKVTLNSNDIVSKSYSSSSTLGSIFGSQVKEYVLGDDVTSIGSYAFYNCSNVTSITIADNVTSVGDKVFEGTEWYNNQPDGLIYVGKILYKYKGLMPTNTLIVIKEGILGIAGGAFVGYTGLASINIPNSVKSIGYGAFYYCSSLTSINIPNSVTTIGDEAFCKCSDLTSITIPNSVTSIGSSTFEGCSKLTSVTIPNSVTSIGSSTFSGCSQLTSVTIPNSVKSIGSYAFSGCSGLTSITIPNSVTSIGDKAFNNCYFEEQNFTNNSTLDSRTNNYWNANIVEKRENDCIINNNVLTKYVGSLYSVVIPNCITSIASDAFSLYKPTKVIWLTNTPPEGYTNAEGKVNYVANNNYTNLSNKTVYPFLSSMFEVDGIKYVPVSPSERTCDVIDCVYNNGASTIDVPSTVTYKRVEMKVKSIQPYSFYMNAYLKKIELGSGITSIGDNAFFSCSKLESIIISDAVTSLGSSVFSYCSNLSSVIIGKEVRTISNYAFNGCSSLPMIQIPQSVTFIGDNAFSGCSSLKTVIMDNGDAELSLSRNDDSSYSILNPLFADCPLDSVYIGRNITYNTSSNKGYSPFYRNTSLRTVVITDKETEISDNEFYGCTNLQNFKVGDGVTKFGKYAFSGCSSLKSLSFGAQLQSIGQEAFSDCNAVTTIVSKATTPPVCGSQALDDISKWECSLYVPEGTLSAYQAANQWKEFFFVEEGDPFAILRGDANGDGKVDMDDATFVTNIILGTEAETEAADVNNDGKINIQDVMFIVNYIKNGKFPDEE